MDRPLGQADAVTELRLAPTENCPHYAYLRGKGLSLGGINPT